jgi:hypothetical protein
MALALTVTSKTSDENGTAHYLATPGLLGVCAEVQRSLQQCDIVRMKISAVQPGRTE